MGEWRDITLGDLVALQRGHDLTEQERRIGSVPVMGSAGQNGFHDIALALGPGIIIGRSGASFGQVHYSANDYWPHNTGLYVTDFKGNDPRFAYYFLKSLDFNRYNSGSAQPSLNRNFIYPIPIRVPMPGEQKAIAAILGSLDDKIELNRRMNATLEEMARALFQSWFVDFDPVRAKLDGKKPVGLDEETAALFPAAFQDSPLGAIPEGWHVATVDDVVEGIYDGPHATPPESNEGPIFLGIKNLTGSGIDLSDIRHISEDEWPKWTKRVTPRHNDIVFSYEATLGFFALIPAGLRCCLGRRLALIRPKTTKGHPHFWFHQFIGPDFQRYLIQHSVQGATVDRIPLIHFPSYVVLNPPTPVKNAFEDRVAVLWAKIHANADESRTLAALRDTLLPKLLSGELRVPDVDDFIQGKPKA